MVGSYAINGAGSASALTNGVIPQSAASDHVVQGAARTNIDGKPIMGGRLTYTSSGVGSGSAAAGYNITSMNGGMQATCSAFPLWMSTNHPYNNGGTKVTTNWIPLAQTTRGI